MVEGKKRKDDVGFGVEDRANRSATVKTLKPFILWKENKSEEQLA